MANNKDYKNILWHNYEEINKFDIVYANYPYFDSFGNLIPIEKPHYCLVTGKFPSDKKFSLPYLTVAYGTSQKFYVDKQTDLLVDLKKLKNPTYTGLICNTKFEIHKSVALEYTKINFVCRDGASDPLVGSLDIKSEKYLSEQFSRIAEGLEKQIKDEKE